MIQDSETRDQKSELLPKNRISDQNLLKLNFAAIILVIISTIAAFLLHLHLNTIGSATIIPGVIAFSMIYPINKRMSKQLKFGTALDEKDRKQLKNSSVALLIIIPLVFYLACTDNPFHKQSVQINPSNKEGTQ